MQVSLVSKSSEFDSIKILLPQKIDQYATEEIGEGEEAEKESEYLPVEQDYSEKQSSQDANETPRQIKEMMNKCSKRDLI